MYVDAIKDNDTILLVERVDEERVYREFPVEYYFYIENPKGKYTTIFGTKAEKITSANGKKFRGDLAIYDNERKFESDINPIFKCLEKHYRDCENPKLNVCFFDIETDFDPQRGFSSPDDPFAPITAITCYLNWADQLITLVLPPPTVSMDFAQKTCTEFENTFVCDSEEQLLETFYDVIEDADILSGWNSGFYDIPYIIRRTEKILNKELTRKLCLWNKLPLKKEVERGWGKSTTFDLVGRVHLDYLDIYKKHTYSEQPSYKLDSIGFVEVGETKTQYEGSLDDLYKKDFKKFIEYNRQDVMLLVKIDRKLKFMELSNQLAHQNSVTLKTTLGSVALIEQSIVNESHDRGMVMADQKTKEENDKHSLIIYDKAEQEYKKSVAGAYVAEPQVGLSHWIGSIDINSLYPSVIRSLNMGPETIVAQIRQDATKKCITDRFEDQQGPGPKYKQASMADCWNGLFGCLEYEEVMKKSDKELILDMENGDTVTMKAWEIYNFIFEQNNSYCLSANGTIFRTDVEGIIPGLLRRWYDERVEMKNKAKVAGQKASGVEVKDSSLLEQLKMLTS
jgi:DNA polymerase elongation subunit (family B)